ncbi:MAG: threonine synthase [Anaerolineae bacterium]|nr:threonine synthase [Anaerolineae bacterium]
MIEYISTNKQAPAVSFQEALFRGLAPDGGLYFPTEFPRFSAEEIAALCGQSLQEVARRVMQKWFGDEISAEAITQIANEAQHFPIPLRKVGGIYVLELFHGPTLAFKDIAAQNLPRLMSYFLLKEAREITLLVATSGDTGGAVAHGFSDIPNITVYVLFPKGRVSGLQEQQLTRVADNIVPVEVDGYFDDCQALVKQAFTDPHLSHLNLTSANSISIGRLIPQIIYYVHTYAQLCRDNIQFIVPSGNFGNLTGGLFARAMGLPFSSFIAANNVNDAAVRYIETAHYEPGETIATLSNAMDVGNPSNFVRVLELFDHDYEAVRDVLQAYRVDDAVTVATIQSVYAEHGYLLDPHTAVGWRVAADHGDPDMVKVLIATASPAKFANELQREAGIAINNSAEMAALQRRKARKVSIPNRYDALVELLRR